MTTRMLPPTNLVYQTITTNGRTYTGVPGSVIDCPDQDAMILAANGWSRVAVVGPTANRPTGTNPLTGSPVGGSHFMDTTLGKLIIYDGATWRDPATGTAA